MSDSTDCSEGVALRKIVRTAAVVTGTSLEDSVMSVIACELSAADKTRVLELYDDGEVSERVARLVVGEAAFADAVEKRRGAEVMLSGDTTRFLTGR